MAAKSGKNKNQTASERSVKNAVAAEQQLRRTHTCNECGCQIKTRKELVRVRLVTFKETKRGGMSGKARMVSRCTNCK